MTAKLQTEHKVAVFEEAGGPLVIKKIRLDLPGRGEVSASTSRQILIQAGVFGNSFPIVPGHEAIGEVVAVGEGEDRRNIGDRVGGVWHARRELILSYSCSPLVKLQFVCWTFTAIFRMDHDRIAFADTGFSMKFRLW